MAVAVSGVWRPSGRGVPQVADCEEVPDKGSGNYDAEAILLEDCNSGMAVFETYIAGMKRSLKFAGEDCVPQ